jgi:endonuclease/exonuclease/phosphatase family metal-dependent hydrolase
LSRPSRPQLPGILSSLLALAVLLGCANACAGRPEAGLVVMSYNVHNLFDAVDDGGEYPEFRLQAGNWDDARYRTRLERLARVILAAAPDRKGPDLVCLLEIENRAVLEALRGGPLKEGGYRSALLIETPGQAVNCGLLSRLPVKSLLAHGLSASGRGGRYMLEARFNVAGRDLTVFACHWKSKIEGAEATEAERVEAAALLAGRAASLLAADPEAEFLACGDFNEGPGEYGEVGGRYETAFLPLEAGLAYAAAPGRRLFLAGERGAAGLTAEGSPVLWSPWTGAEGYSYVNKGRGERIDGFLLPAGLLDDQGLGFETFAVFMPDFLVNAAGSPLSYNMTSGSGFSDHLPIVLRLSLARP